VTTLACTPCAETADQIYEQISSCLASPEFKPRALYERFKIELLATTDDPCDDLTAHQFLRDDESWQGRVIPTFRPDKYLEPGQANWNADVDRLAEVSGVDTSDYDGYIAAMEKPSPVLQGQWCSLLRPQPLRRRTWAWG
jgi:glucuronate isomerase